MSETSAKISLVEKTLRSQRDTWGEISQRVAAISGREFPHEPAKRIIIAGVGSSYHAAKLAGFALIRDKTRVRIPIVACNSMSVGMEVVPTRGDWFFGITHRGRTPVTLQAMDIAEQAGAFTLQVSGIDAPNAPSAKMVLNTVAQEPVEPHTASVTGAICAISTLLSGQKAVEEWDALRSIGDPDLETLRKRAGEGPTVLIGEWEGEWLAREGALKLLEMADLASRAYGSEEFFHGPRFAYSPEKDRVWHVSMPKDPRNAMIRAAHSIGIYGATPLAWVPALVELQWLSLAVELKGGFAPDRRSLASLEM